ncbi:MAG: hypothetical protein N2504_07235 [candidate division WOR-3 bacterium]|nr:hypothetical protein [candidate division WOR-3 bacterium]MCX7948361.1 hypothetical protein [candidate division WOR-3 bacterium]MDW8151262.1 hypothetical protein [candidate division WOR-3 bacterium]
MDYLKEFIYIKFKLPLVQEYKYLEDTLIFVSFIEFFGLENPLGIFAIDLYPDLIEAFHNWHKNLDIKGYNLPCC